jgi:hypothetical protein
MHIRSFAYLLAAAPPCVAFSATAADAPPASAPPSAPATKPRDAADELFRAAGKAFDAGRFSESEELLEKAWALKKTHDIAGNLGITKLHLGKHREAATHLAWSLRHMPPTERRMNREGLEAEFKKARAEVGGLRIQVNIAGADVLVNGADAGKAPLEGEVFVDPGTANVTARLDGYSTPLQSVTVGKGDTRDLSVELVPIKGPDTRRSVVPGVVLAGVAGVALATGIGLFVVSGNKYADSKTLHDAILKDGGTCVPGGAHLDKRCDQLHTTAATSDRLLGASVGLFIGAGAAAIATGAYLIWARSVPSAPSPSQAFRVVPAISPSNAGLLFSGSF